MNLTFIPKIPMLRFFRRLRIGMDGPRRILSGDTWYLIVNEWINQIYVLPGKHKVIFLKSVF